jgi:hypothetical protein
MTIRVRKLIAMIFLLAISPALAIAQEKPANPKNSPAEKSSTPAKLSREEELRRERMRARLDQPLQFNGLGAAVSTSGGDLYLKTRDGKSEQLTKTEGAEIAPQISKNGKIVAGGP